MRVFSLLVERHAPKLKQLYPTTCHDHVSDSNKGKRSAEETSVIDLVSNPLDSSQPLDAPEPKRYKFGAVEEKQPGADGSAASAAAAASSSSSFSSGVHDAKSLATLVVLVTSATDENSFVQVFAAMRLIRVCKFKMIRRHKHAPFFRSLNSTSISHLASTQKRFWPSSNAIVKCVIHTTH